MRVCVQVPVALLLIGIMLPLHGCRPSSPSFVPGVRDSAGVRIVHLGEFRSPPYGIRLESAPLYRLGWDKDGHEFALILDGALLPGGAAVVADLMNREAVAIAPDGEFEGVLGRRGEGPGEVAFVAGVGVLPPDTILLKDDWNARFTLFNGTTPVRSVPNVRGGGLRLVGIVEDQPVLGTGAYNNEVPESWIRGIVARFDMADGRIDTLLRVDMAPNSRNTKRFGPQGVLASTPNEILVGRTDRAEIRWIGLDGKLRQVVRWGGGPPRLTEDDWAVYEDYYMTDPVTSLNRETRIEWFSRMRPRIGMELPYFGKLLADDTGRVWMGAFSTNWRTTGRFDVFAPDGSWLGSMSLPRRMQVLDIREDRLLATEADDLGRPSVVVYKITWTRQPPNSD